MPLKTCMSRQLLEENTSTEVRSPSTYIALHEVINVGAEAVNDLGGEASEMKSAKRCCGGPFGGVRRGHPQMFSWGIWLLAVANGSMPYLGFCQQTVRASDDGACGVQTSGCSSPGSSRRTRGGGTREKGKSAGAFLGVADIGPLAQGGRRRGCRPL